MAEGWARHLRGGEIEPRSAGTEVHGLDPLAVKVMGEAGVDISGHRSKLLAGVKEIPFDLVVTVCDRARESCPLFPGAVEKIHAGFADPPRLAAGASSEEEALRHYRRVRDEIRDFVAAMELPRQA